jgi:hypothetical protein
MMKDCALNAKYHGSILVSYLFSYFDRPNNRPIDNLASATYHGNILAEVGIVPARSNG